jgi:hypothetical protein
MTGPGLSRISRLLTCSVPSGVSSTPAGGELIILGAKIFDEDLFVGKAITLRAPMGGVVIN